MPRLPVLVVLLVAMLWQTLAMARVGSSVNVLADPAHAALHWHEEGHHHHDDGTYHVDHSGDAGDVAEAVQHVLSDPVSAPTALLTAQVPGFPASGSSRPVAEPAALWPDHLLDGLLRPPRSRP